jgi:uncharacterized damage-inducible protein DinB
VPVKEQVRGGVPDGPDFEAPAVYLDHHRLTLLRICAGLTAEELTLRPVPPSSLSLLGLVRHMTEVESAWLCIRAAGQEVAPLFPATDEDFADLDPASEDRAIAALPKEWMAYDAVVAQLPLEHSLDARRQQVPLPPFYIHLVEDWAQSQRGTLT